MSLPLTDSQNWADRFVLDEGSGALIGGRCDTCSNLIWPMPRACMRCGSLSIAREKLNTSGIVETWTRVWIPIGNIQPPYFIGRVRLGECSVFGRIQPNAGEEIDVGVQVRLLSSDLHEDKANLQYWFEVLEAQ